jgi:hypothetical protein
MRHESNINVKYEDEDEKLEESKEEEIPEMQIAKVVEKNGTFNQKPKLYKINHFCLMELENKRF